MSLNFFSGQPQNSRTINEVKNKIKGCDRRREIRGATDWGGSLVSESPVNHPFCSASHKQHQRGNGGLISNAAPRLGFGLESKLGLGVGGMEEV